MQHSELEKYTMTDLRKIAKEKGLNGYSGLRKIELINMLTKNVQPTKVPVPPFTNTMIKDYKDIVEICDETEWKKGEYINKGANGQVYVACRNGDCNYVMKIQEFNTSFYTEVQALVELQKTGVVPIIYAAWTCRDKGYIIMEKLDQCTKLSGKQIYDGILQNLTKIHNNGWLVVDVNTGNYLCRNGGKQLVIIDFGFAVKKVLKEIIKNTQITSSRRDLEKFKRGKISLISRGLVSIRTWKNSQNTDLCIFCTYISRN